MSNPYQRKNRQVPNADDYSTTTTTNNVKKRKNSNKNEQREPIIGIVTIVCIMIGIATIVVVFKEMLGIGIQPNKRSKHQIRELLSNQHERLTLLHERTQQIYDEDDTTSKTKRNTNNYDDDVSIHDNTMTQQQQTQNNKDDDKNKKLELAYYAGANLTKIPSSSKKITVIIMNHARPYMIQKSILMATLTSHPSVALILLCHSNPETIFTYEHSKVINVNAIDMNEQLGLALRFYYCSYDGIQSVYNTSSNTTNIVVNDNTNDDNRNENNTIYINPTDWILHIDDDMELDYNAIDTLISYMSSNSKRLLGYYGRSYNYYKVPFRHGYDYATTLFGPVEVVLTKIVFMERIICQQFIQQMHLMDDYVRSAKTIAQQKRESIDSNKQQSLAAVYTDGRRRHRMPLWNGEDIFVNLVANKYYNVPKYPKLYNNYAIQELTVWENTNETLRGERGTDISGNMERNSIWNVGLVEWYYSILHGIHHAYYRGKLWYIAKQRLYPSS